MSRCRILCFDIEYSSISYLIDVNCSYLRYRCFRISKHSISSNIVPRYRRSFSDARYRCNIVIYRFRRSERCQGSRCIYRHILSRKVYDHLESPPPGQDQTISYIKEYPGIYRFKVFILTCTGYSFPKILKMYYLISYSLLTYCIFI